jgi:osomolarity two-component system, phosphorelay intermediate protein YPD1
VCIHRHSVFFCSLTCLSVFRGKKNLSELSSLGHFLKGSSAALGVFKVQLSCEHIQHYGHLKEGTNTITEAEAIVKITNTLARTRDEFAEAKRELESIYEKKKKETTSLTSTLSFF